MALDGRLAFNQAFAEGRTTRVDFIKSGTPGNTGTMQTLQRYGSSPAAITNPATTPGTAYTANTRSITFPNVQPDGYRRYITEIEVLNGSTTLAGGSLFVYDLFAAVRFTMAAGSITINSLDSLGAGSAPPRLIDGFSNDSEIYGVQAWISPTATTAASVVTMNDYSYFDIVAGVANATGAPALSIPAADPANSMYQLPFDAAATSPGVVFVNTLNCASGSGTYDLMLIRPIATIALPSPTSIGLVPSYNKVSFLDDYLNPLHIQDGTCVQMAIRNYTANAIVQGSITTAFG